jgi:Zn finger protein HypA/HybF involved in hydrogenase expression
MPRRPMASPTLRQLRDLIRAGAVQSQVEAARKIGLSRQRVNQLVLEHGLELRKPPAVNLRFPCTGCGTPIERRQTDVKKLRHPDLCWRCGQATRRRVTERVCSQCGKKRLYKTSGLSLFTTELCRTCWQKQYDEQRARRHVTLVCPRCKRGRSFTPSRARVRLSPYCNPCWMRLSLKERQKWASKKR